MKHKNIQRFLEVKKCTYNHLQSPTNRASNYTTLHKTTCNLHNNNSYILKNDIYTILLVAVVGVGGYSVAAPEKNKKNIDIPAPEKCPLGYPVYKTLPECTRLAVAADFNNAHRWAKGIPYLIWSDVEQVYQCYRFKHGISSLYKLQPFIDEQRVYVFTKIQ